MSGWKSRWSCVRLVNTAAATWIPSARRSSSACEEISIAHASSPASAIAANVRWRSIASGVVRTTGCSTPPITDLTVPSRPQRRSAASSSERTRNAVVVLPLVPVMPTTGSARRRVAVEARRGDRHRRADVRDLHLGHAEAERPRDHQRRRPARDGVGGEVMAVAGEPGHAEEQVAGLHRAVVVGQAGDLHVGRTLAEQVAQGHRPGSLRARAAGEPRPAPPDYAIFRCAGLGGSGTYIRCPVPPGPGTCGDHSAGTGVGGLLRIDHHRARVRARLEILERLGRVVEGVRGAVGRRGRQARCSDRGRRAA